MDDRFKFRVFDKTQKTMGELVELKVRDDAYSSIKAIFEIAGKKICNWFAYSEEYSTAILMQCTGFKDKNGVLVYEGDLLEIDSPLEIDNHLFAVHYETEFASYVLVDEDTTFHGELISSFDMTKAEIVGNIHTHPKLLEGLTND